jgi:glyoxylase-like metal-dependent hydrolase (beta-lactamase superfamily II)
MNASPNRQDLGGGLSVFQAPLWQTNSLVAFAGEDALLCDPAFTPAELEAIVAATREGSPVKVFLLVTHADYDHVCGIPYLPEAEVICGRTTAERIADGRASNGLKSGGAEWGVEWLTDLRVDREIAPGADVECGSFRVVALNVPSHGREGLAYVLPEQGVLLVGDNLSPIGCPLLGGPLSSAIAATEELLAAIDRWAPQYVVPGHGRVLSAGDARRIGEEDLDYLRALQEAAREAASLGLAPGHALVHIFSVQPPRPATPDFQIYDLHGGNARHALADIGLST